MLSENCQYSQEIVNAVKKLSILPKNYQKIVNIARKIVNNVRKLSILPKIINTARELSIFSKIDHIVNIVRRLSNFQYYN